MEYRLILLAVCAFAVTLLLVLYHLLTAEDVARVAETMSSTSEKAVEPKPSSDLAAVDVDGLMSAIIAQQFKDSHSFSSKNPGTLNGLFPSQVRINFHGEPLIATLRQDQAVEDLSSLPTLLILNALLEASVNGQLMKPATSFFVQAIEALSSFRAPIFEENKSALMTFWPGQCNDKADNCRTMSENVEKGGQELLPFAILAAAVDACKGKCPVAQACLQEIKQNGFCLQVFNQSLSHFSQHHNFSPDVTSSFTNLALGTLLFSGGDTYSSSYEVWKNNNANFSRLVEHAGKFAYRPATSNSTNNVIDSRSYYIIEEFLSQKNTSELQNVALVTNWIPNSSVEGRLLYGKKILPIFNSLDLFGTATFLYAVTSSLLHNLITSDSSTQMLIQSNLDLLTWIVSNNRSDDLELLMSMYPSSFQFYWMLSRTMFELENARERRQETFQLLEHFYSTWNTTVRSHVTRAILNRVQDGGLDENGKPLTYVDDIIGIADVDESGKTLPSAGDRLFSTSAAASALIFAWTVHGAKGHNLFYLHNIPTDVTLGITRLVNFVAKHCCKKGVSLMNVIHSTIYKHCQSLPYGYPANVVISQNGTNFTGQLPAPEVLFGVQGHLTSDQYKEMLNKTHFEIQLPKSLPGLNSTSTMFFFWSSPAYTQAMNLLAVAQLKNVKGKVKRMEALMDSAKT